MFVAWLNTCTTTVQQLYDSRWHTQPGTYTPPGAQSSSLLTHLTDNIGSLCVGWWAHTCIYVCVSRKRRVCHKAPTWCQTDGINTRAHEHMHKFCQRISMFQQDGNKLELEQFIRYQWATVCYCFSLWMLVQWITLHFILLWWYMTATSVSLVLKTFLS